MRPALILVAACLTYACTAKRPAQPASGSRAGGARVIRTARIDDPSSVREARGFLLRRDSFPSRHPGLTSFTDSLVAQDIRRRLAKVR
jgi:hypothetical protein